MKKVLVLMMAAMMAAGVLAQSKHVVTQSSLTFKIKNLGFDTGGSINGLVADISFDKDKPESSAIAASADVNTINTDNEMRDKHLKSEDYFDALRYPKISMRSVAIKHRSGNNYVATFNVTIKDKTKTVDVPFTYVVTGAIAHFKGSFKIQRSDFGIGSKGLTLGNDVTVEIDVETSK
jgi:polyisoprenoid-binding protein YceI